jgi:hypothetical protein
MGGDMADRSREQEPHAEPVQLDDDAAVAEIHQASGDDLAEQRQQQDPGEDDVDRGPPRLAATQ